MAVMCSSALMFNVRFVSPKQTALQSLQFSWYTALFPSSFGFDNRLRRVVWVQNVALMLCLLSARLSCSLSPLVMGCRLRALY